MSIDWFTFAAQLLNFILLVWLLKRFLYRPIQDAIVAREKRISAELANAAAVEAEAQQERDKFQHSSEELQQQREALLAEARRKAQAEYERLLDEAREASDAIGRKRMQSLRDSVENLQQTIGRRVQQEVFAISRKVLAELSSESLQERMTTAFVSHLRALDAKQKSSLRAVFDSAREKLLLRSAFELSPQQRQAIQQVLGELAGADIEPRIEIVPDLVGGIELVADGHKLAWSISDYLLSLKKGVSEILPPEDDAKPSVRADEPGQQADS
jgi:F-type H+-transporting ATPase subunit b